MFVESHFAALADIFLGLLENKQTKKTFFLLTIFFIICFRYCRDYFDRGLRMSQVMLPGSFFPDEINGNSATISSTGQLITKRAILLQPGKQERGKTESGVFTVQIPQAACLDRQIFPGRFLEGVATDAKRVDRQRRRSSCGVGGDKRTKSTGAFARTWPIR